MYLNGSAVTHTGNVRDKNEDHFFFIRFMSGKEKDNGRLRKCGRSFLRSPLMGVFDGMGGISAGERASEIAARCAKRMIRCSDQEAPEIMLRICETANNQICSEMKRLQKRMGTTASMMCFSDDKYYICNIGDSPVFMLRDGILYRIFREHTERQGYEQLHGASDPQKKFRLTQYLGIFPNESVISPYSASGECMVGDRFLICSDGLSDVIDDGELMKVMSRRIPVDEITDQLLQLALSNGSKDNITAVCGEVISDPPFRFRDLFRTDCFYK